MRFGGKYITGLRNNFMDWLERTEILFGDDKMKRLKSSRVLVVGIGGVGAYAAEMICRAGVGNITIADSDAVALSNINRQLPALHSTVGKKKVAVMADRLIDINPELNIEVMDEYIEGDAIPRLLDRGFDFVVDAIDTISPKCDLIAAALESKTKIISSMGAGAKSDITKIQYADIWKTYNCGLSKAVRNGLKKRGIKKHFTVVFSSETADRNAVVLVDEKNKKSTTGTVSYMPAVFGCYLAGYVIKNL